MSRAKGKAQAKKSTVNPQPMFGNYEYSLTQQQQSAIQSYLRFLPSEFRSSAWELLHDLTYARTNSANRMDEWTKKPKYPVVTTWDQI